MERDCHTETYTYLLTEPSMQTESRWYESCLRSNTEHEMDERSLGLAVRLGPSPFRINCLYCLLTLTLLKIGFLLVDSLSDDMADNHYFSLVPVIQCVAETQGSMHKSD